MSVLTPCSFEIKLRYRIDRVNTSGFSFKGRTVLCLPTLRLTERRNGRSKDCLLEHLSSLLVYFASRELTSILLSLSFATVESTQMQTVRSRIWEPTLSCFDVLLKHYGFFLMSVNG